MKIQIDSTKKLTYKFDGIDITNFFGVSLYARSQEYNQTVEDVIYSSTILSKIEGVDDITFTIAPLQAWSYGCWDFQILDERIANDVKVLEEGQFFVIPSIKYKARKSQTEKDYDAVENAIRSYGTSNIQSYTISGRQINRLSLSDLTKLRNSLFKKMNKERQDLSLPTIKTGIPRTFRLRGVY